MQLTQLSFDEDGVMKPVNMQVVSTCDFIERPASYRDGDEGET